MNTNTQRLLDQVNTKLKNMPLFYFSREVERSIGLENLLENYHIACIEDHYIVDQLIKNGKSINCLEKHGIKLDANSSLNLLSSKEILDWMNKITNGKEFYAQFFQPTTPAIVKIQSMNGTLLNNDYKLNRFFENKLSQYQTLKNNAIKIPKGEIVDCSLTNYAELKKKYGEKIVIQLDRAHTGSGTFFIESLENWDEFIKNYNGNIVKVTEYISGEPYTLNACIASSKIYISGLQYQITGYSELTDGKGSTVGNDWSYANTINEDLKSRIVDEMQKIGEVMQDKGYRGLFGVDLIVNGDDVKIIEINARQTANIPMQTKIELQSDVVPLSLLHLAEFLNIKIPFEPAKELYNLEGSQVFLRAKENEFKINNSIQSGIYRLQSDNSARDWKEGGFKGGVIMLDEDGDKPLIWQSDGYSVENIHDGGLILLVQKVGTIKKRFEELARMQFKSQIVHSGPSGGQTIKPTSRVGKLAPWTLEAMSTIERMIK